MGEFVSDVLLVQRSACFPQGADGGVRESPALAAVVKEVKAGRRGQGLLLLSERE